MDKYAVYTIVVKQKGNGPRITDIVEQLNKVEQIEYVEEAYLERIIKQRGGAE